MQRRTAGDVSGLLVFVGAATYDALALVENHPAADERVVASTIRYAGGGPAATAAVAAARLGHRTAFAGAVGDDDEGALIRAGLETEGVDTGGLVTRPGVGSAASVVIVATATSTRSICNRPHPLGDLDDNPAARDLLAAADWVHVDHMGWAPTMTTLPHLTSSPKISYDGGHQVPDFTAAGIELYAPTVQALAVRFGNLPADELLRRAQHESGRSVVATDGAHGSLALTPDGSLRHLPAFEVGVVSTLGAGDVFHGALVAALAEDRPLEDATVRANAVAALSCRALDGRSAVPTREELEAFLDPRPTEPDPGQRPAGPDSGQRPAGPDPVPAP